MSTAQRITIGFGIVYLAAGVLGFVPGITVPSSQPGQGLLLGILAVNALHNIVHILLGAALIWGGMSADRVTTVNKALAVVFALLVPASLIAPVVEQVPLNLPDTILHLASALLTGHLGFMAHNRLTRSMA